MEGSRKKNKTNKQKDLGREVKSDLNLRLDTEISGIKELSCMQFTLYGSQ